MSRVRMVTSERCEAAAAEHMAATARQLERERIRRLLLRRRDQYVVDGWPQLADVLTLFAREIDDEASAGTRCRRTPT